MMVLVSENEWHLRAELGCPPPYRLVVSYVQSGKGSHRTVLVIRPKMPKTTLFNSVQINTYDR